MSIYITLSKKERKKIWILERDVKKTVRVYGIGDYSGKHHYTLLKDEEAIFFNLYKKVVLNPVPVKDTSFPEERIINVLDSILKRNSYLLEGLVESIEAEVVQDKGRKKKVLIRREMKSKST